MVVPTRVQTVEDLVMRAYAKVVGNPRLLDIWGLKPKDNSRRGLLEAVAELHLNDSLTHVIGEDASGTIFIRVYLKEEIEEKPEIKKVRTIIHEHSVVPEWEKLFRTYYIQTVNAPPKPLIVGPKTVKAGDIPDKFWESEAVRYRLRSESLNEAVKILTNFVKWAESADDEGLKNLKYEAEIAMRMSEDVIKAAL